MVSSCYIFACITSLFNIKYSSIYIYLFTVNKAHIITHFSCESTDPRSIYIDR